MRWIYFHFFFIFLLTYITIENTKSDHDGQNVLKGILDTDTLVNSWY